MGSKGSSSAPSYTAPVQSPSVDFSPMYAALAQMTEMTALAMRSSTDNMYKMLADAPTATADSSETDWANKMSTLRAKMSADMTAEAKNRRGRESTIVTSPLTETEPTLVSSILTGN